MTEAMTLIERLRNPAWETNPNGGDALLNVAQTRATMDEAAKKIEELEAQLALKSGMGIAENRPDTFGDLKSGKIKPVDNPPA